MTIAASDPSEVNNQPGIGTITNGAFTISWVTLSDEASFEAEHARSFAQQLAQTVRAREPLVIRLANTGEDCTTDIGDADLCVCLGRHEEQVVVHELVLPGTPNTHVVRLDLPWDEAQTRIVRLLKAYLVERCQRDTFATWVRELPTSVVRTRLGLAAATPETTSGVSHTASSFV